MSIENKSYRGTLVETIVMSLLFDSLFETTDKIKEILQERLRSNLKFETNVSDIETIIGQSFGNILFNDENNIIKVIHFTIIGNQVISVINK